MRAEAAQDIARGLLYRGILELLPLHLRIDQAPAPLHCAGGHDDASRRRGVNHHVRIARVAGNRFEAVKGGRKSPYNIRINDRWRMCFASPEGSPGPTNVRIVDYH